MMMIPKPNFRAIADFIVVGICVMAFCILLVGIASALLGPNAAGSRDFIEYWAAGHQLIHGANPYDFDQILKLELSAGFPPNMAAQVMANPPSVLLLMLPLGMVGAKTGESLWLLLQLMALVLSMRLVRQMHGNPKNLLHVLAYGFAPVLSCLLAGQVSIFILLGLVSFLRLHATRPFMAGASLWLCLLKPHLFLPFGVVLLAWIVVTRSYRIAAGVAATLAVSSAIATILNSHIWSQYLAMMSAARVDRLPLPCLSIFLREHLYPHNGWVQCLPALLGCVWAAFFYWERRSAWNWIEHGSPLMLVAVLVAPYSWFMDQSVLLPALLYGLYRTGSRNLIAALALMSAAIEIGTLRGILLYSNFYLWTAPGWLVWYVLATRVRQPHASPLTTAIESAQ